MTNSILATTTTTTLSAPSKHPIVEESTAIPTDDPPLFSSALISPEVIAAIPTDYTVRPLRRSDYHRGYLEVLRVLTSVGDVSEDQWNRRYDWICSRADEYFLLVVCDGADRVVGTGSLIVERKFIHSLGLVGHIEDIAVEKGQQGKKLGLRIIQALDYVAAHVGCYKVSRSLSLFFHSSALFCDVADAGRRFSTAPSSTRASMSNAASSAPASKWPITINPPIRLGCVLCDSIRRRSVSVLFGSVLRVW
jgi:glucosamine-phosphate N-acetyltransferase